MVSSLQMNNFKMTSDGTNNSPSQQPGRPLLKDQIEFSVASQPQLLVKTNVEKKVNFEDVKLPKKPSRRPKSSENVQKGGGR